MFIIYGVEGGGGCEDLQGRAATFIGNNWTGGMRLGKGGHPEASAYIEKRNRVDLRPLLVLVVIFRMSLDH